VSATSWGRVSEEEPGNDTDAEIELPWEAAECNGDYEQFSQLSR